MVSCPQFYVTLEGGQVLASSNVGLSQESKGVVYMGELGGLVYLPLVVFVGMFQDGLPNILCQRLVCVGYVR